MRNVTLVSLALGTLVALDATAGAAGNKIDVCHVRGNGSINVINVSVNAANAHLNHGDHLPFVVFGDADGDGYGDADDEATVCEAASDDVTNGDDCDDGDSSINPDAADDTDDGIDNNCNGEVDEDHEGQGNAEFPGK